MKRRTRLGSSPVKVFGCHVYPLDGSRTKVHIKSFRTVSEAREFALTMVEAMHLHSELREFESVSIERGNGEEISKFSVFDHSNDFFSDEESREAPMHPQGASLERASATDIDRSERCVVIDSTAPLCVFEGFAPPTATLRDGSSLSSRGELPGEFVCLLAPRLGRGGGA